MPRPTRRHDIDVYEIDAAHTDDREDEPLDEQAREWLAEAKLPKDVRAAIARLLGIPAAVRFVSALIEAASKVLRGKKDDDPKVIAAAIQAMHVKAQELQIPLE